MAINLASKYEKKVAERFTTRSKTDGYVGKDYEFTGVKSITVYSVDTVSMTDYTRSGTSRFGTLTELGDTKQDLKLTKDRAFTFSIDAGNASEQFNIKQANACLKRQIDEVITPEIDKYRLKAWVDGNTDGTTANNVTVPTLKDGALTKANVVEKIFTANATMTDKNVPIEGRVLFISELDFLKFKLSDQVTGTDGIAAENLRRGYRGTIDGLTVVTVPSSYMPTNVNFIIKHRSATVDPFKLKNYRVHKNPMGVDGDVVEGRIIYDSFVLSTKKDGIIVSSSTTT